MHGFLTKCYTFSLFQSKAHQRCLPARAVLAPLAPPLAAAAPRTRRTAARGESAAAWDPRRYLMFWRILYRMCFVTGLGDTVLHEAGADVYEGESDNEEKED